jgi:5'-3' exonuclease
VKVAYLAKGISNHDLVNHSWIQKKYEIPGERYALFAMIRGDASDGLPGIKGIGEKGAADIAKNYSSMAELLEAAKADDPKLSPNHRKKILADLDYASVADRLVQCARDVNLPEIDLSIPNSAKNAKYLETMKSDYGLGASVDRLISAFNWS